MIRISEAASVGVGEIIQCVLENRQHLLACYFSSKMNANHGKDYVTHNLSHFDVR